MAHNFGSIKKWALAISIAIVFNLFINYGIATFYKAPEYEDFCNVSSYPVKPVPIGVPYKENNCTDLVVSDNLSSECASTRGIIQFKYNATGCPVDAYCDTCNARFEDSRNSYDSNIFFVLVVIGVAALIGGLLVSLQSVGTGFLFGGIISIIIGTIRNWSNLTDVIRFLLLGLILLILIFVGYKKVRD